MYHAIVKRIARKNFERVNQHDFEALLADSELNPFFSVLHHGDHRDAVGGMNRQLVAAGECFYVD